MDWARENLRGQWTTLMTPFTPDDEVDEQGLRGNIRHIRSLGTRGGGCTWAMGEFWSLTREERTLVYDVVSDEAGGDWPIGAHVTHTSAREMLALARHAESSRVRSPNRCRSLLCDQDRGPGRRVRKAAGRRHGPGDHVLQLSPVRDRDERTGLWGGYATSPTSSASRRPASTRTSPSKRTSSSVATP